MPTTDAVVCKHTVARTVDGVRVSYSPGTVVPSKGIPAFTKAERERLMKLGAVVKHKPSDDEDVDGESTNDDADDKDELIAKAKKLGVKGVNKNWGEEKLKDAIAAAEAGNEGADDGL